MKSLALATAAVVAAATLTTPAHATGTTSETRALRSGIRWERARTWHWQTVAGVPRSPTIRGAGLPSHSPGYLRWIERRWNRRRLRAYKVATRPPQPVSRVAGGIAHEALWLCIHSGRGAAWPSTGEGAWNANTGNGYLGGLQMTPGWGGVARPDLLSPMAQMALAERQYRASRYLTAWLEQQWPMTSPPCLRYAG